MEPDFGNKLDRYRDYMKLTSKERQKKVEQAKQSQQFRRPNPQGNAIFPEINFFRFYVIQDKKKIQLHTFRYEPTTQHKPIALLFMFHGLNSHMGHGAHLAEQFANNGIITVGFDHRGFGQSEGRPGFVQSFDQHYQDSKFFVQNVKRMYQEENLPTFCLGLSMGGLTTYHLTLKMKNEFDGAIMMAPAMKNSVGKALVGLTKIIHTILPEKSRLVKPVYGQATRNPQVTDEIKKDPYAFHERACTSTLYMLVNMMDKSPQTFKYYNCPFMIIQGGCDKLVNPEVAFELYKYSQVRQEDKEIMFYEGMWHDIWHEEQIWEILLKVNSWIKDRARISRARRGEQ